MRCASIRRRPSLASRQRFEISGSVWSGQNSGRERDSLIRAEISLIADLNSLQGRKNSLFGCVGNWPVRFWFDARFAAVGAPRSPDSIPCKLPC
jgi:hypothetical protein